jgi:outer membrane protein insertion porin family
MTSVRTLLPYFLLTSYFLLLTSDGFAQDIPVGQPILEVLIEQEGKPLTDPLVRTLIETTAGEPLSMLEVRESIDHLMNLRRFEDVQPMADVVPGGVRLRYVLVPTHPVDRVEFTGTLGVGEGDLRRMVVDRFGRSPAAARRDEIAAALIQLYRDRGYPGSRVTPRIEETHDPDRATLYFEIEAGRRAVIADVSFRARNPEEQTSLTDLPRLRIGQPYDRETVEGELRGWEERMKEQGFYEARATYGAPTFADDAYIIINISRGPRVVLQFAGDPLPADEQERLVPIRAEGAADEDLLEDAQRNIESYLHARGYRDASAPYTRQESLGELIITFNVTRGPRYLVESVTIGGNSALTAAELQELLGIRRGEEFVLSTLQSRAMNIENTYRARGFTDASVTPVASVLPSEGPANRDRRVEVRVDITEGPRTTVKAVTFEGPTPLTAPTALTEAQLRTLVTVIPGNPFSLVDVQNSSDAIHLEYRNRGYESSGVRAESELTEDSTQAVVRFIITEGPQSVIDHIIITGNDRTGAETITRALRIYEGGPLGYSALLESRAQLAALGLFRRVEIQPLRHSGESRRDVLIVIEEADPSIVDFAPGIEGGFRSRLGDDGQIEERFDFAPRGSFTIGRRNLWGKNRAVTLFTRVSLRSTDVVISDGSIGLEEQTESEAFNEYRVVGTFSEPRAFSTDADILFTGVIEQGLRTSFNFSRRIARAETVSRVSQTMSVTGRYSFEKTKIFDERLGERDPELPSIDRLFPEVRLSRFAGSLIHDTRNDPLDPSRGIQLIVDGDLAARAIGSQIGFVKTYIQAFTFRQLPTARRIVAAFGARFGAARGFERDVDGQLVADLPASERFFAGGDTTVRGFSLDRLGNAETINPETGFPGGGNGVVILNSELRVTVIPRWQAVGFVDAGNVFVRPSDVDLTDLRPAAGFGLRYYSDYLPVRLDLGFNLDRRELLPGRTERGVVFHVSFGQAF